MRITFVQTLLIMLLINISWAVPGSAQNQLNKTISVMFRDEPLETVIEKLEKMTGVSFVYSREIINSARTVSITAEKQKLGDVLNQILGALSLQYKAEEDRIIIRKARSGYFIQPPGHIPPVTESIPAEKINGVVTDEKGDALPGVNIVVKGTARGTASDARGEFQIEVPDGNAVLMFSFVGFTSQEILVGNQNVINVRLAEDTKALREVVVTALGMKREKRSLGYSVGEIGAAELNRVPQENVLGGLQGKITGLQINNSSPELNAETHVYIRGTNSLTNNDDPLVIVDGVPSGNPNVLQDISSNNIASISVLKGPSAAALYGSRAGNG